MRIQLKISLVQRARLRRLAALARPARAAENAFADIGREEAAAARPVFVSRRPALAREMAAA